MNFIKKLDEKGSSIYAPIVIPYSHTEDFKSSEYMRYFRTTSRKPSLIEAVKDLTTLYSELNDSLIDKKDLPATINYIYKSHKADTDK